MLGRSVVTGAAHEGQLWSSRPESSMSARVSAGDTSGSRVASAVLGHILWGLAAMQEAGSASLRGITRRGSAGVSGCCRGC